MRIAWDRSGVGFRHAGTASIFVAGLLCGAYAVPHATSYAAPPPSTSSTTETTGSGHPAEVVRVIDGDTFEARVRVWPGMEAITKVRLRGVDAPELSARCEAERIKAEASRDALARMLAQGSVSITRVSFDKYGGRVVADASARSTPDISAALIASGHGRRYGGGRREGWC